jgi:hypothetical protein
VRIDPVAAFAEIRRRRLVRDNFISHKPWPRQKEFLALPGGETECSEALYGGAAGGGKSDALLMGAAMYLHISGYAALILRKSYKDLAEEDAIMDRAQKWWLGNPAIKWDAKNYKFKFPAGSSITFGYLDSELDKYNYQGAAFQCVCFDELTQFTESKYTYLLSRIRRPAGSTVPLRALAASNPGGVGHDWVFKRFIDPKTARAPFVPAFLADNPSLDGNAYRKTLEKLDPVTREQLLRGVWIRDGAGLVYEQFNEGSNLLAPSALPKLDYYVCALDFGVVDENAVAVLGWREHDSTIYIVDAHRIKGLVADVAAEVAGLDNRYHFCKIVGDVGGMGKLFQAELLSRFSLAVDPAEKTNKLGYIRLMNSDLHRGRVRVLDDAVSCQHLIEEWCELPWNDTRTKEADGFNNHAADAALYGWRACLAFHEKPKVEKPKLGTREAILEEEARLERLAFDEEGEGAWH